jgi:hypothetical protein
MNQIDSTWEQRVADLWKAIDNYEPDAFVAQMDALASELPPHNAVGLFERGSAQDSTGHPDLAVPLYRAALNAGLTGLPRRRATIQLASSLRNLGNAQEAADLLSAERAPPPTVDGAVTPFALALAVLGVSGSALSASPLCPLPRYNRSLARYASRSGNAAP